VVSVGFAAVDFASVGFAAVGLPRGLVRTGTSVFTFAFGSALDLPALLDAAK
jgi:hypothetical protein